MADDDLELLRELLDTSEDEYLGEVVRGCKKQEVCVSGATNQATLRLKPLLEAPPNKRLRLTETANPLVAGPATSVARMVAPQARSGSVEKFSGLRMKNACFPSEVLKERLSHVRFDKLSQARSKVGADAKWATIAVVTEKDTKKSAKGNKYGIWRLSDLQGTNVSLFLTGKAQADLCKETEGSVVAVFKPEARIAASKLSLSVDSAQQVVKLGTSTDMAFCRAKRKDGTPCRNAVNIGACPFCDYHVQDEYNKIHSKRTECKDSRLYRAFQYADGSRLGSSGRPKMTEDGDILYAKPRSIKPRSQQELQQAVERAQKHMPGAARLLAAMLPGQSSKSVPRAAPKEYGPNTNNLTKPKRQAQASSSSLQSPSPALTSRHNNRDRPQVPGQPTSSSGGAMLVPSPRPQAPSSINEARGLRQSAGLEGGPDGPHGSDKGMSPAGGGSSFGMQMGIDLAEGADDLMIQEDGVEWGDEGGAGDPALQHALAVILSKGPK